MSGKTKKIKKKTEEGKGGEGKVRREEREGKGGSRVDMASVSKVRRRCRKALQKG